MAISENTETILMRRKRIKPDDDLSDEALEKDWNKTTESIKDRNPDCPYNDGKKGKWVKMLGWQGAAEYACPNGHRFSMLGDLVKKIED